VNSQYVDRDGHFSIINRNRDRTVQLQQPKSVPLAPSSV
jgi:hypothetical protein